MTEIGVHMTEVEKIAAEVKRLTPSSQLRLAADLIEQKQFGIALSIVRGIAYELEVVSIVKRHVEATEPSSDATGSDK